MKDKLVIVSYFFPPFNNVASRRWAEMIPELSKNFDVYVFTTKSEGNLEIPLGITQIHRFENFLLKTGRQSKAPRSGAVKTILASLRSGLRTIDSTIGHFYLKNRREFTAKINGIKPDYIVTSLGPFSTVFFGYDAKKLRKETFWICDVRDSISLYPHLKKNLIKKVIDRFIDKFFVSEADYIITVSNTLANIFSEFYDTKTGVVYNGFVSSNSAQNITVDSERESNVFTIFYGGKMYLHQMDSLKLLCRSISHVANRFEIKVRLVNQEVKDTLEKIFESYSITYEIMPPTTNEIFLSEAESSDILLMLEGLEKDNEIGRGTLTGKLFNYLSLNGTILSICRNDSEIQEILNQTNRGVVIDNEEELERFLSDFKRLSFPRISSKISKFSRESQAKIFERQLNELE